MLNIRTYIYLPLMLKSKNITLYKIQIYLQAWFVRTLFVLTSFGL